MAIAKRITNTNLNIVSIDPITVNEDLREIAAIIQLLKERMQKVMNAESIQILINNGYTEFEIETTDEGIRIIPTDTLV